MSPRTLVSRLARSRAEEICDRRRFSSVRGWGSSSRGRARLVDFRAEAEDSESSRRVSWARRAERWGVRASVHLDGCSRWGHQTYSLENVFQLGFGARLFFGGFGGDVGHGGILGVAVEEG